MEKDLIEQSITRTYRASIWSRFIKALKEFNLLKENDSLILVLSMQKDLKMVICGSRVIRLLCR